MTTALPSTPIHVEEPSTAFVDIDEHLQRLALQSRTQYRLWCHRQGFSTSLEKTPAAAQSELDRLADTWQRPQSTARRHLQFEQIAAGDFDPLLRKVPESRAVIQAFESFGPDEVARRCLLRLMLHVDRYTNVMSARHMGGRIIGHPTNNFAAGLAALVRHRHNWLRDPETWSSSSTRRRYSFRHLARHLLAQYPVPDFMDHTWFESDPEKAHQWQSWWIHVGVGGNIRRADTPIRLTKRMAHVFTQAPERTELSPRGQRVGPRGNRPMTILTNLRWAQVVGMGGSERLAHAVIRTRLGRHFDNDEFWSTVVLFLVNNPMLETTWAGPVVDYAYNMKFAPQRILKEGGGVEEAPPPHPDFTMRRRSATKLLRQIENWHGFLARESYVELASWTGCGIRGWETETEEDIGAVRWTVQELCSSWELAAEGRAMNHCVASYAAQCVDGVTSIWSIGAQVDVGERQGVLTVAVDNEERVITQARGRYNAVPQGARSAKMLRQSRGYLQLLDASARVLRQWRERERLRQGS